jgi:hypothetical protein
MTVPEKICSLSPVNVPNSKNEIYEYIKMENPHKMSKPSEVPIPAGTNPTVAILRDSLFFVCFLILFSAFTVRKQILFYNLLQIFST